MRNFINKKNIFWDFDGVIMDSMPVRNKGFEIVLNDYPKNEVSELLEFHLKNGGLSRYVKFRYFFERIRNRTVSDEEIDEWSEKFSKVMKKELIKPELLINDSLRFIEKNHQDYEMHIVSGSDQKELRYLCSKLGIDVFFKSINGSPTPKIKLVQDLLFNNSYTKEETLLIGDSINDYDAAVSNNIDFYGYNNPKLKELDANYINSFIDE